MKKITFFILTFWAFSLASIAQTTISQNVDPTSIEEGTSATCASASGVSDNVFSRSYVLADFGITEDFEVSAVEFGHDAISFDGTGPDNLDLTITLSTTDAAYPGGVLTEVASTIVNVTAMDAGVYSAPISVTVPADSELVVAVAVANVDGAFFRIGGNSAGQSADSYIQSEGCGITEITPVAGIGTFANAIINLVTPANMYIPPTGCTVYEDFEADTLPEGWTTDVTVGDHDWTFGSGDLPIGDDYNTNAAIFDDDDAGSGQQNTAYLYTPVYDLVDTGSTFATFSAYIGFNSMGNDAFTIEVFDGADWQQVAQYVEDLDPDLQTVEFDATAYLNEAFQIRFSFTDNLDGTDTDGAWNWYASVDDFCLKYDVDLTPENDAPENALPIACGEDVFGDTTNATIAEAVADCDEYPNDVTTSAGIWYTFVAEDNMLVSFSTCGSADFDSSIGIYSGTPGSLVCVVANDDGEDCPGYSSNLENFQGTPGETYYVRVYGYSASSVGTFTMYMTCTDTAGIAEAAIDGFSMYPNPVEDTLNLNAATTIDAVSVYNMLGQEVLVATPSTTQVQMDMSNLQTGAYIVKVQAGTQVGSYNLIKE